MFIILNVLYGLKRTIIIQLNITSRPRAVYKTSIDN